MILLLSKSDAVMIVIYLKSNIYGKHGGKWYDMTIMRRPSTAFFNIVITIPRRLSQRYFNTNEYFISFSKMAYNDKASSLTLYTGICHGESNSHNNPCHAVTSHHCGGYHSLTFCIIYTSCNPGKQLSRPSSWMYELMINRNLKIRKAILDCISCFAL